MTIRVKTALFLAAMLISSVAMSQDYQIGTLFRNNGHRASGGYGAASNKFTTIDGHYANMVELYGGWFVNHKFLIGVGAAALTNDLKVPAEFSSIPGVDMNYQYGQFGMMLEYTLWSHRAIHFAVHSFNGAGFTVQYQRRQREDDWFEDQFDHMPKESNWFFVSEPGVKVEMNLLKWLRFSPGVSYRAVFNSKAAGLPDSKLSGASLNLSLKFGKF